MNQQELIKQLIFDKISDIVEKQTNVHISTPDKMYTSWDNSDTRVVLKWFFKYPPKYPLILNIYRPGYIALYDNNNFLDQQAFEIDKWDKTKEKVMDLVSIRKEPMPIIGSLTIKEEDLVAATINFNSKNSGYIKFANLQIGW